MARLMQTDLSVMISGESGTGKELVARALHDFGRRKDKPFVTINVAATPADAIEDELFGWDRPINGEYQGGRLERAQGGTLFLDEIGDMPMVAQTRLLKVLQDGEFPQASNRHMIKSDVRLIAATHQDMRSLIHEGKFREDLFYRLNVVPLRLPPLRERIEDITDLTRAFLSRAVAEGLPRKTVSQNALKVLSEQYWSGNVRELENLIKRLVALCADEIIDAPMVEEELAARPSSVTEPAPMMGETLGAAVEYHLRRYFSLHEGALPSPGVYNRVIKEVEWPMIALTLEAVNGNQIKAAEILGINRNTLRKKIRELDITVTRGKKMM